MANQDKVLTYVGFAVKARKIVYGANLIKQYKKKMFLLIGCMQAAENSKKEAEALSQKCNVDLIETCRCKLEEVVNKTNCKLVAITDSNLAKAIMDNLGENYKIIRRRGV